MEADGLDIEKMENKAREFTLAGDYRRIKVQRLGARFLGLGVRRLSVGVEAGRPALGSLSVARSTAGVRCRSGSWFGVNAGGAALRARARGEGLAPSDGRRSPGSGLMPGVCIHQWLAHDNRSDR